MGSWAPRRERRQPYLGQHVAFAALTLVGLALLIFYGHLTPWTLMVAFVAYIAGNSVHAVSLSATPDTVSVATGTGAVAPPPALPPLPTSWPELVDGLET